MTLPNSLPRSFLLFLLCALGCLFWFSLEGNGDQSPRRSQSAGLPLFSTRLSSIYHTCIHDELFSSSAINDLPVASVQLYQQIDAATETNFFRRDSFDSASLDAQKESGDYPSTLSRTGKMGRGSGLRRENIDSPSDQNIASEAVYSLDRTHVMFSKGTTVSCIADCGGCEETTDSSSFYTTDNFSGSNTTLGRPLKFHVIFDFNASCKKADEVVISYQQDDNGEGITCTSNDVLTSNKELFVRKAVGDATHRLSLALISIPVQTITVPSNICNNILLTPSTKQEVSTVGSTSSPPSTSVPLVIEDADFVLFVTASPLLSAAQTIAWGRPCVRESATSAGRPIIGQINFIPGRLNAQGHVTDQSIVTTMHEVSHALGFINLFSTLDSYVDLKGVRQSSGGTSRVYREGLQKEVQLVQTPRVLRAARQHFGCPTLDGVEIEDMGGSGTAGSHWKKRLFYQEALVGVVSSASLFYSSLTLSFFEDAGFYKAKYSYAADDYRWGYQRGCAFATQNCRSLFDQGLGDEFCFNSTSSSECTYDKHSAGVCDTMTYLNPLPSEYQYFPDAPNRGGSMSTMDYCPAVVYYDNVNCVNPFNTPLVNIYGSEFSESSRCFESTVITHSLPQIGKNPHCFRSSCVTGVVPSRTIFTEEKSSSLIPMGSQASVNSLSSTQQIILNIQGHTIPCPLNGNEGNADTSGLRGLHGSVKCPSATEVCPFLQITSLIFDSSIPPDSDFSIFSPISAHIAFDNTSNNAVQAVSLTQKNYSVGEVVPPPSFFLTRWWGNGIKELNHTAFLSCSQEVDECLVKYSPDLELMREKDGQRTNIILCGAMMQRIKNCVPIQCLSAVKQRIAELFSLPSLEKSFLCWSNLQRISHLCTDGWAGANTVCRFMKVG